MTLGSPGTPRNVDELPLLLWENPPVCPCLSIPGNVPGGMVLNTGICGDGEKGPTRPVGVIPHTRVGVQVRAAQPFSPGALGSERGVCMCVCASLAKHFKVPQTRCPRWGSHLAQMNFVSPAHPMRTLERSPWLALGNVPECSVCALARVNLVTTWI